MQLCVFLFIHFWDQRKRIWLIIQVVLASFDFIFNSSWIKRQISCWKPTKKKKKEVTKGVSNTWQCFRKWVRASSPSHGFFFFCFFSCRSSTKTKCQHGCNSLGGHNLLVNNNDVVLISSSDDGRTHIWIILCSLWRLNSKSFPEIFFLVPSGKIQMWQGRRIINDQLCDYTSARCAMSQGVNEWTTFEFHQQSLLYLIIFSYFQR